MLPNVASDMIAILGKLPPPYGGVSVHLQRLLWRLQCEGIGYNFFDLGGSYDAERYIFPGKANFFWLCLFLLKARRKYALIHCHFSNPLAVIAVGCLMLGSSVKVVHTLHGSRIYEEMARSSPSIFKGLLRYTLKRADHLFSTNSTIASELPKLGFSTANVTWMPAFIPPGPDELDICNLPDEVQVFLKEYKPLIGMQAWFGSFLQGRDIYNLECVPTLISGLAKNHPKIGLCTVISGTLSQKHRSYIYQLRDDCKIADQWMILELNAPAVPLFARCDIFLRPTITDGDSLSVRECLFLGIPVVASDAVPRPSESILFSVGSIDDMIQKTNSALNCIGDSSCTKNSPNIDYIDCLIKYYENFTNIN